ncbi:MAG TPA: hypothetical protein VJ761_18245 [Ktedonobacteraceae bacterium]|nr:hypothetical protein [Ktedonobacteraceae bacterium]
MNRRWARSTGPYGNSARILCHPLHAMQTARRGRLTVPTADLSAPPLDDFIKPHSQASPKMV